MTFHLINNDAGSFVIIINVIKFLVILWLYYIVNYSKLLTSLFSRVIGINSV